MVESFELVSSISFVSATAPVLFIFIGIACFCGGSFQLTVVGVIVVEESLAKHGFVVVVTDSTALLSPSWNEWVVIDVEEDTNSLLLQGVIKTSLLLRPSPLSSEGSTAAVVAVRYAVSVVVVVELLFRVTFESKRR